MALNANDAMGSYRPFSLHWLDSAAQETLLPGLPWQRVYERLSQALAKRIHPELTDPDRRAAILDLLGSAFSQKYLSKWTWELPRKNLEDLSPEERRVILQSTQLLLKDKLDLAAKDCGYLIPKNQPGDHSPLTPDAERGARSTQDPEYETGGRSPLASTLPTQPPMPVPEEVIDTIATMASIFTVGKDRFLAQENMERSVTTKNKEGEEEEIHELTYLRRDKPDKHSKDSQVLIRDANENGEKMEKVNDLIPNCWGQTSDLLGQSLCAILRRDPSRLDEVCKKLSGRQLPSTLRQKVWNMVLLRNYKTSADREKSSEWFLRKSFIKTVLRGKAELGIDSTTKSPINGLLETAVHEKYSCTPCMLKHQGESMSTDTREALNILYVFDRSYQPYYIDWLYPMQLALYNGGTSKAEAAGGDDRPYELALQLHLLRTFTFPRWSEILAVAQDVMAIVETSDPEFYSHLVKCSKTNVKLDPKDFLVQQIQEEQQKANSLSINVNLNADTMAMNEHGEREMLASPAMFLRKWLGDGFVGVCDTQAILFIWDQCYMQQWSHEVLLKICLSLLLLLREPFMLLAQDYHVMKKIFLGTPCKLYTLDIQRAFQHLEKEGSLKDIPSMNRRPVEVPERKKLPSPTHENELHEMASLQQTRLPDIVIPTTPPLPTYPPKTRPSPSPEAMPIFRDPPTPVQHAPPPSGPDHEEPVVEERLVNVDVSKSSPEEGSDGDRERNDASPPVKSQEQLPEEPSPAIKESPVSLAIPEPVWVSFDLSTTSDLPAAPEPKGGFDLYVDGVRFLPDNATIAKITGQFVNSLSPIMLSAQPDVSAMSVRACPKFTHRTLVHAGKADMLVVLQVHTLDRITNQVVVVGTCILPVYDRNSKKLNIGGYQLRLHSGYPSQDQPVLPQSVDHLPRVPGCSILVRLLPYLEDFLEAPPYQSGFYHSEASKPNESEINVINHYKTSSDWSQTEKEAIIEVARKGEEIAKATFEAVGSTDQITDDQTDEWSVMSDAKLQRWAMKRLEDKESSEGRIAPRLLDLVRCVNYDRDAGVAVKLRMACGFRAENRYCVALTRVVPGRKARENASEGTDGERNRPETFLTKRPDMDSPMQSPRWKDRPRVLHPFYDEQSVLLLQFFGLEVTYEIDPAGLAKGVVKGPKGKGVPKLDTSSYLGWGVVPLFDRRCLYQGTYVIPIFQDTGDWSFLKGLLDAPSLESWMRVCTERATIQLSPGHPSAIVSIWDAHFYQGQTVPLPKRDHFLHLAGDQKQFAAAAQQKKSTAQLNQIVLRSLPSVVRQEGTAGQKYLREQQNFQDVMVDLAANLMESALLSAGQSPLSDSM